MRIAIFGAGNGGAAAVAELTQAGHAVTLWNRSAQALAPFRQAGGVAYDGVLGEGFAAVALMTTDARAALRGCDGILVCLPTTAHRALAMTLAAAGADAIPVVLDPGQSGGALEFRQAFIEAGVRCPPLAAFSTLTYVSRKLTPEKVTITGAAKQVRMGALPGGEAAAALGVALFRSARRERDVLAADLANMNMVLHPPGAILGAAWVEAKAGEFTFYVEAMTPGVARTMAALDAERLAVARAYGHALPSLVVEMKAIGTVEPEVPDTADLVTAIAGGRANSRIKAPGSLSHRYYVEDFGHGLVPFLALAHIAGVACPTGEALVTLAEKLTGNDFRRDGRTAARMGLAGLDRAGVLRLVGG